MTEEDLNDILARFSPPGTVPHEKYLRPVNNRKIVTRMLNNLKMIYLHKSQLNKALATINRILLIAPDEVWNTEFGASCTAISAT